MNKAITFKAIWVMGLIFVMTLSGALTEEQVGQVKTILSKYDPAKVTETQIKEARSAFREARIPGGPDLDIAIKAAGFDEKAFRPPKGEGKGEGGGKGKGGAGKSEGPQFTIEQATSDRAQLHTLAYDAMAWLSGSFYCDTFLPPGKVSDFFGFQYLRDNDAAGMGHNTSFLTRIANNMMALLTAEQKAKLVVLGKEQTTGIRDYAVMRYPLMKAFRRVLDREFPAGKTKLDPEAVKKFSADLYELDGRLFLRRAEVMAQVLAGMTPEQKKTLDALAKGNWKTWPDAPEGEEKKAMSHDVHVALMTYVSELFSWYAGTVESDTYFCPEGIAKYFGSFYVKDAPAVRNPNYSIGMELTGEGGADFIKCLNDTQRPHVTNLVHLQKPYLNDIIATRRLIAAELRKLLVGGTVDKAKILEWSRKYGELDGMISYHYAMGFSEASRGLTEEQKKTLLKIRALDEKYTPTKPFVYADPIDMPPVAGTDGFFK